MKTEDFYDVIDGELDELINNQIDPAIIGQYKQPQQKKSYAFLVWFLDFYAGIGADNSTTFITDGHQDNSCDIILGRTDSQGVRTFYLVQSKWNSKKNCRKEFESVELKSFLSDAQSVLFGDKEETSNPVFNARYRELVTHVKANGRVKILYLTLKNASSQADENIANLKSTIGGGLEIEGIDINRLKRDYISKVYKKSLPPNPLERIYTPEEEEVEIRIVRNQQPNHIEIDRPYPAHVFTIQPKLIFDLVEKYGVSLFHRNIRNPLQNSVINADIERSLQDDPALFWYYNNGITAITKLLPAISTQAESFKVIGLQIINGAQTAYSIHRAYKNATPTKQKIIDNEARITFRLINSGSSDFDLRVTKFTNSQNPVSQRDFWSNDDIQEKIQNYFYETNFWYEKRSGEFQELPDGIHVVSNEVVARAYLSFWLLDPITTIESSKMNNQEGVDLIFTSHKDHQEGMYERVFNKDTDIHAMFSSFCMFSIAFDVIDKVAPTVNENLLSYCLSVSRMILGNYLKIRYGDSINLVEYISKKYISGDVNILMQSIAYANFFMFKEFQTENTIQSLTNIEKIETFLLDEEKSMKILRNKSHFELLLEKASKYELSEEDIEAIERGWPLVEND